MSNYTSSDFSVRKTSTFCNIFPAHCTTIMLPTTATTSEATHCRLSDNIPIIMESTMTTTSKSFFFCFCNGPNPIPHPPFFIIIVYATIQLKLKREKKPLTHYNMRHSNCVSNIIKSLDKNKKIF